MDVNVEDVSPAQRLGIGIVLVVVGSVLGQPNLGLETRISAFATLFGIGFLGAAFEPPLTNALGARGWADLSSVKQTGVLFVLAIIAIVLWLAVSLAQSAVWSLF
ncbi:hypothetical protein SAMN05444422_102315 [Halobiforma haloterrestris]|uniref:Uncharacterized protein n=1 Tax=Natronobacterium haloterrestre TaxID=148448 RepID=A0A1I1E9R7_NATHA|nr:hypothetical protein [Halobiforma haloterrestris]SFB83885.1 hypothetical protein SAMN05444422_102315 [Halobiforma haloterrestris]